MRNTISLRFADVQSGRRDDWRYLVDEQVFEERLRFVQALFRGFDAVEGSCESGVI